MTMNVKIEKQYNNVVKIHALPIAEAIESIDKEDRAMLEKYSFADFEGAIKKYSKDLEPSECYGILQLYLSAVLQSVSEQDLKDKTVVIMTPDELHTCTSYLRQQMFLFQKGMSVFQIVVNNVYELLVQYYGEVKPEEITWHPNILGIVGVDYIVKDDSYFDFWTVQNSKEPITV